MNKNINLCFDGRLLKIGLEKTKSRTGIYFVALNLVIELSKRKDINFSIYLSKSELKFRQDIFKSLGISEIPILTDDNDFSVVNAFLSPFETSPSFIKKYPNISCYIILHDIIPLLFPEYFLGASSQGWFGELISTLNSDDYYFTNSDYTKKDFLRHCPNLDAKKVMTIPLSSNLELKPNNDKFMLNIIKEKYHIPQDKKYLFSLCSLEPRKNLIRAVRTFIDFISKNKIDDLVFVLGGGAWDGFIEKFEKEVPDYQKYKDKIIRAGYVADEDLEVLYSNAEWFVYTSQYEGFGMPPLEAMRCGTAVITSNNSSLPEVVGDAGIMIDWDSDEQHIQAYEKYYFDKKYRDEMAQKGLERSKQFSWEKAVDIILNKMREIEKKKENKPLVTIITPSFNLIKGGRKDWFIQNIKSVQNQTYKNIEHIVIDGASKDGTIDLLEEYQKKGWIKYYSAPDKGIYDAMNKGILKAKGKYVVCLNSDDFYCNDRAIEMLVQKAEEQDADATYANALRIHPKTLNVISHWNGMQNFKPWLSCYPCHQTFLIKTAVMKELGLYNVKYKVSADNNFFMRMIQNNKKIIGIDMDIISFREGGFSDSNLETSYQDQSTGLFEEYGKYHNLTPMDCSNLFGYNYLRLPLDEAVKLGSKLEKKEWIEEYFNRLFKHHLSVLPKNQVFQHNVLSSIKTRCHLFACIPFLKIQKGLNKMKILLFGVVPLIKFKRKGGRRTWWFLGLPVFKIRNIKGDKVRKYYLFNIPILKVSIKGY